MNTTGNYVCFNGKMVTSDQPLLAQNNRSFRYGDGIFETMKMMRSSILLKELHFERLFGSLQFLQYNWPASFTAEFLENFIQELAVKNNCNELCRVRLTVFRGNGNLYPAATLQPGYLIECTPLDTGVNQLNEKGYSINICRNASKTCDVLATIKSASFLPYVLGALYAEENSLNDALLLNASGNIADATIANIFIVKDNALFTPALSEGCINGVMRRYLLQQFSAAGLSCLETILSEQDLSAADEIFLTNAIHGIRWVKNCAGKEFQSRVTLKIYNDFIKTISF